ncbi:hypothetical protein BJ878DRAFT_211143 [Calycina marina]|uniref:Inner kinetochore subunit AME1 domain-containing protein n=1 Tax=Calycina marina TaxID=1763456 RepID=A0A9P7YXX8_9HELO|nr:hypothetical protein BJ878DRAFT_211143 [Calycina marina]
MDTNMAETREERMQQRLRGAQRRQVEDVDFGLSFPVLSAPPIQQSIVPQDPPRTELPPQPSGRTSGALRGRSQSKSTPAGENTRQTTNDANTSAKRQKLSTEEPPAPSSFGSARSSLPRPDIYALPGEEFDQNGSPELSTEIANDTASKTNVEINSLDLNSPPAIILSPPTNEGPEERNEDALTGDRHPDISLEEAIQLDLRLEEDSLVDGSAEQTVEPTQPSVQRGKRKRDNLAREKEPLTKKRQRTSRGSERTSAVQETNSEALSEPVRHCWRRSSQINSRIVDEETIHDISVEKAEQIDHKQAALVPSRTQNRRRSRDAGSSVIVSNTIPRKSVKHYQSPDPAPQQAQKAPKPVQKSSSKPDKRASKQNTRLGIPIPVTVHRINERLYYDDDETNAEILNLDIPHIRRGGVNAVDVLAQICEETVSSGLDTLHELISNTHDSAVRREYNTKMRALEAFSKALQTRLIEHTINLDNTFALEKRVRGEQRKKVALREEILRVRGEREQLALRMDEVRIKHESEATDSHKRDALNITIHDIEMAIERGKAHAKNPRRQVHVKGTELLVKRVAGEVSHNSDSGGFLKQIKEFNAFMERAALSLETRAK